MATVTVADVAITIAGRDLVLIRRAKPPFMDKRCLPGGHIKPTDADAEHAAAREVREEVNLHVAPSALHYLCTLDAVWRDARPGRWVSTVFHVDIPSAEGLRAGDDAKALVIRPLDTLQEEAIGFDHWEAIRRLRGQRDREAHSTKEDSHDDRV